VNRREAEGILRETQYWHYPFQLPWGRVRPTKADHGDRHQWRWRHFFAPLLEAYGGSLTGKTVLDLGCCQGFWTFEAVKAGAASCLGLDATERFVEEAEAARTILGFERCEFRRAHLGRDRWAEALEPFHVTLLLGLLYHLDDPLGVLRDAMQLTTETIVIDTEVGPQETPIFTLVPRDAHEPTTAGVKSASSFRLVPSPSAIRSLLVDGGFDSVRLLTPDPAMLPEYRSGHRISVIAQR